MLINRVQPEPEYVLRLSYEDLHSLYHTMLDISHTRLLDCTESDFFHALKEHV